MNTEIYLNFLELFPQVNIIQASLTDRCGAVYIGFSMLYHHCVFMSGTPPVGIHIYAR